MKKDGKPMEILIFTLLESASSSAFASLEREKEETIQYLQSYIALVSYGCKALVRRRADNCGTSEPSAAAEAIATAEISPLRDGRRTIVVEPLPTGAWPIEFCCCCGGGGGLCDDKAGVGITGIGWTFW